MPTIDESLPVPRRILPSIVLAEFAGTSLWFATNAVLPDLEKLWHAGDDVLGLVTSSVQAGFILGTLCFAFFTIADRFSPRRLFLLFSLLGALCNLLIIPVADRIGAVLVLRVLTGICLAGIYPVGMKIASGWYKGGLGNALGLLVGALVLGTAFPHFVRSLGNGLQWEDVMRTVAIVAAAGGMLMYLCVPDGPFLVKGTRFSPRALALIFRSKDLRAAAFGYFGHMWELYTFYAFVPSVLTAFAVAKGLMGFDRSLWAFLIIGAGCIGCVGGGVLSLNAGSARVAWTQLCCSGILCIVSPLLFHMPAPLFLGSLVLWGIVVVGDSPQFSSLIARNAPPELVGSALTIGNSIGFAITIASIETLAFVSRFVPPEYLFTVLTIGPVLGLLASRRLVRGSA